ncbi:ACP phosphodiesterase [Photobacterium proteolyticum]|uniref:ACP phosphodiesterase n=1 Tax=Photobacterium proteolyticum TaxID=1903952 RepID=A0A1Q9GMK3_9GAMM|nr:ACP phosphodiesterase [Photobacterium proteolyticum]OLQ75883.1 ACP phosphodiesterase [Photobacterium proteolyticum]
MNFLAHLHLADRCCSHMAGNLLADFVRGDPYQQYPLAVADGIKLHRFVDSYIDAMPEVLQCRQLFTTDTRRVSGIALDIAWDHFLAKHWPLYHPLALPDFVSQARQQVEQYQDNLPDSYRLTMSRMWQQQWLLQYRDQRTITTALERMALRRPKLHQLANCPELIDKHYDTLELRFHAIYPQVIRATHTYRSQQ